MKKYDIPTGDYAVFREYNKAIEHINTITGPIVLKADGLCGGKGVVIAGNQDEAKEALKEMMLHKAFGASGEAVIIEQFLEGEEYSLMAFVQGEKASPMVVAQDHKRIGEGETGLITGGMGAYSPVPQISEAAVNSSIVNVLAKTMVAEGLPFTGFLYGGLILTVEGPKVIEFNCRLGNPEAEVVLPLLKGNLGEILLAIVNNKEPQLSWEQKTAFGVYVVGKGYPGSPVKCCSLTPIMKSDILFYFHGATIENNGGRNGGSRGR